MLDTLLLSVTQWRKRAYFSLAGKGCWSNTWYGITCKSLLSFLAWVQTMSYVCHACIYTCGHNSVYVHVVLFITHLLVCFSVVVESYELTGRHTYFATAISAVCALVLILSLAALHKNLAPKSKRNKDKDDDDDLTISATCKLSLAVTELETAGIINH